MSTFYDRFRECSQRWPDNVALEIQRRDQVEGYTYAELRQMAESIGHWLPDENFRWVPAWRYSPTIIPAGSRLIWASLPAEVHAVPLDTAFHTDQVAKLLKDSGSELMFCDAKHLEIARQAVRGSTIGIVRLDTKDAGEGARATQTDLDSIFDAGPGEFVPVASSEDALASLLYTSGTTADPKGVMLTHGNLMGEVEAVFGWADLGPDDAVLGVLPLFHVLSQMANLLLPLVKGVRVVYLETLNTTELLRALSERKITAFAVVPQFFYLIHERIFKEVAQRGKLAQSILRALMAVTVFGRRFGINLGKVFFRKIHRTFGDRMRYLVTGGSRFDPQIALDFHALGIDVLQAYGLTETTGAAFATSPHNNVIGSVGPPLTGVEVKILDPQPQEDVPLPVGEILIRGAIVMKGYWNRPDATADVLKDGWLYTGDFGYVDAVGNLFITGRKKDVIILSNGKNIYPEEVETHYLKSPYIKEICVLGLEGRPGDPKADRFYAVVVPNFDALKQRKITNAKEVIRFDIENLSAQLPSTKRIGSYEIWQEDLPRTTTRKLKRFEIAKRVKASQGKAGAEIGSEKPLTEEDLAWLDQAEVQRVLKIIREAARSQPQIIRPDSNLELDLGLDSMQRVELLVALEQEIGGDVEESRLAEVYTARELVDIVRESAASGAGSSKPRAGWDTLLREQTTDPEVLALGRSRRISAAFWFLVSRLIHIAAADRFHLRATGLEKIPPRGPFILCSNHQSYIDPIILGGLLPWSVFRDAFAVGTSEIFGSGPMRTLARWLRVVVVDPDANLIPAMRAGAFGLGYGRVLVLYPEGERSIDGSPKRFKKGAAILSIHMQVPIVPVAIDGFYETWPRGKPFLKFTPLRVKIGDPIFPPPEAEASEAAYEKLIAEVKARVVAMWEQLEEATSGRPSS